MLAGGEVSSSREQASSSRMAQRPCALDPFALAGIVHRFPQVCPPLDTEPEVGAVAEYARQDQRRGRGHGAPIVAQLVDMLALNAHRVRQRRLSRKRPGAAALLGS